MVRRRERFDVEPEASGRLDRYLAERLHLSRTRVAALIEQGLVTIDGRVPRKSDPVVPGQAVSVTIPPVEPLEAVPEDLPITIVYQDAHVAVVDKPPGLVVHPSAGHPRGTLVNALLHHIQDLSGIGGTLRPGIVHRLDKDTSGLLVVAKTDAAHQGLSTALRRREVSRRYMACSWGHLSESPLTVEAPIGRDPTNRKRMAVVEGGRSADTRFIVRERWLAAELLDVKLGTGRTHQIRVHLLHVGHPIVGDSLYGAGWERGFTGTSRSWARDFLARVPRQFLHARKLSFTHPVSEERMVFRIPPPPDLVPALKFARTHAGS